LAEAGAVKVFSEKISGASASNRNALAGTDTEQSVAAAALKKSRYFILVIRAMPDDSAIRRGWNP